MKVKVMTLIISAVFMALFILFLLPVTAGIKNIGNIAGAFVSGVLTLIFFFWSRFTQIVASLWEKPAGRAAVSVIGAVSGVCVLLALVISGFMIKEMNDKPKCETTIIVLGCQVKESGPSLMLLRRLNTAYSYLVENEDINVIVSGGQGADEPCSEASCMYDYLVSTGISPDRIYIEDKSANTEENIVFSKELIEREGLCPEITIVTDGFHQLRADMFAKEQGIRAYNISAPTALWLVPTYWVREWFGIAYYTIF